jgi:hypothetical protein
LSIAAWIPLTRTGKFRYDQFKCTHPSDACHTMSRYVFILGAGASRHTGAPLMAEFLDRARALFAANPTSEYSNDLQRVFGAISKLQSVHSKSELDIVNLESCSALLKWLNC